MIFSPSLLRSVGATFLGILAASPLVAAESTAPRSSTSNIPAATSGRPSPSTTKSGARGPIPDPALLDGSTQAPEKKSEIGMIGDFELPGDENARSGKVGGPQGQMPQAGGGGGQQSSMPMGLPQGGGAAGGQQSQQGAPPSGAQSAQGGGAQAGGPQNPNAAGNPVAGGGDPGAQPQGIQVAELGGEASGQQGGPGGGPGEKPQQVALGDSTMRIDPSASAPGVIGGQQQQTGGHTQQHEKGTGTGGKGSGGSGSGNRVEKGRSIPAGL